MEKKGKGSPYLGDFPPKVLGESRIAGEPREDWPEVGPRLGGGVCTIALEGGRRGQGASGRKSGSTRRREVNKSGRREREKGKRDLMARKESPAYLKGIKLKQKYAEEPRNLSIDAVFQEKKRKFLNIT